MRISDWSSDVCSSDLMPPRKRFGRAKGESVKVADRAGKQQETEKERSGQPSPAAAAGPARSDQDRFENGGQRQSCRQRAHPFGQVEIGRASGRERVCQYV